MTLILDRHIGDGLDIIKRSSNSKLFSIVLSDTDLTKKTALISVGGETRNVSEFQKAYLDESGHFTDEADCVLRVYVSHERKILQRGRYKSWNGVGERHARLCIDAPQDYKILRSELTPRDGVAI